MKPHYTPPTEGTHEVKMQVLNDKVSELIQLIDSEFFDSLDRDVLTMLSRARQEALAVKQTIRYINTEL